MQVLDTINTYFEYLNYKQFQRIVIIFFSTFFFISFIILYVNIRTHKKLTTRIRTINRKRTEVRELLERYELVKRQKSEVDSFLEKDKDFKIAAFFDNVLQHLNLLGKKTRDPETSAENLENGYREIKLFATFSDMNMKQLIDLLDALEQNERIYTKELELYKPEQAQTINVNILIATLEPRLETVE